MGVSQIFSSGHIIQSSIIFIVSTTVKSDSEPDSFTIEIQDDTPNRVLPAELESSYGAIS